MCPLLKLRRFQIIHLTTSQDTLLRAAPRSPQVVILGLFAQTYPSSATCPTLFSPPHEVRVGAALGAGHRAGRRQHLWTSAGWQGSSLWCGWWYQGVCLPPSSSLKCSFLFPLYGSICVIYINNNNKKLKKKTRTSSMNYSLLPFQKYSSESNNSTQDSRRLNVQWHSL